MVRTSPLTTAYRKGMKIRIRKGNIVFERVCVCMYVCVCDEKLKWRHRIDKIIFLCFDGSKKSHRPLSAEEGRSGGADNNTSGSSDELPEVRPVDVFSKNA